MARGYARSMFTHTSHSYLLQVAALYCSFVPALAIFGVIVGAWRERHPHWFRGRAGRAIPLARVKAMLDI